MRRSRSPTDHSSLKRPRSQPRHHRRSSTKPRRAQAPAIVALPFHASSLSKHDFDEYRPVFGLYLDIQKHLVLHELTEHEVRGRWKSFVGKWNRGDLAEGWYEPATLHKAQASAAPESTASEFVVNQKDSPIYESTRKGEASSDDEFIGPTLAGGKDLHHQSHQRLGPSIPKLQDLALRKEIEDDDTLMHRQNMRYSCRIDHREQKEHLEDLIPRAEAGSKDRLLENKRAKADNNRVFASSKTEAGGEDEMPDADLLGEGDGAIDGLKKQRKEMERKKNEREIRRDEILRAKYEEREERLREYRAKEEKTMAGLFALARSRFG